VSVGQHDPTRFSSLEPLVPEGQELEESDQPPMPARRWRTGRASIRSAEARERTERREMRVVECILERLGACGIVAGKSREAENLMGKEGRGCRRSRIEDRAR
jgi:hypothetical protein